MVRLHRCIHTFCKHMHACVCTQVHVCNITASCNIKHVQQASTDWLNIIFHGPCSPWKTTIPQINSYMFNRPPPPFGQCWSRSGLDKGYNEKRPFLFTAFRLSPSTLNMGGRGFSMGSRYARCDGRFSRGTRWKKLLLKLCNFQFLLE